MLGANPSVSSLTAISYNKDMEKELDIYVKMGTSRSFTWDNATNAEPYENVYFLYWFAAMLPFP